MAAFSENLMLHTQFPTRAICDRMRTCLARNVVLDVRDLEKAVLVVRHQNEIVSCVKENLPELESEIFVKPQWHWHEGINLVILFKWTQKGQAASERSLVIRRIIVGLRAILFNLLRPSYSSLATSRQLRENTFRTTACLFIHCGFLAEVWSPPAVSPGCC